MLGLALAGDRQDVILDLEVDVLLGDAREVGTQHEVVLGLGQVHRRHPATGPATRGAVRTAPLEEGVEETIHGGLQDIQLAGRIPSDDSHLTNLLYSVLPFAKL